MNRYNRITETRIALRTESYSHALVVLTLAAAAVLVVGAGVGAAATTWYVDGGGGADYDNIQDAVNAASDGDTIFVHSGMYNETVIVNRSLTLQGENKDTTIIDGSGNKCIKVYSDYDNVSISGFTVQNGSTGISIDSNYDEIFDNIVISCSTGIGIWDSDYINITNNTVLLCNPNILLEDSDHNNISNNIVYSPHCGGIKLENSSYNMILNNIIYSTHGSSYGIKLLSSMHNEIYHNDLINNTNHAYDDGDTNLWDKGPVIGGNYWSDHECTGEPSDGTQPYYIDVDSIDHYPFGHPVNDVTSAPPPEPIVYVGAQMRERLSTYETHIDHNKDYEFEVDTWRIEVSSIQDLRTDNITYTITTPMNFTYLYNSEEYTNGTYDDITFNFTQTGDNYTWVLPMKDRISSEIRLKPLDEEFRQKKPCADMDVSMIDENNHTRLNITIVPTINCSCGLDIRGDHIINVTYPPDFCIWWLNLDWDSVDFGGDMVKSRSYNFSILLDNPGSVECRYTAGDYEWGFCYSNNFARPVTELGSIDVASVVPVGWEYDVPYPEYKQYIEIDLTPIPDLTMSPSDITFSNPNPVQGENITLTAEIHNIGTADASNVIIQFRENPPNESQIENKTVYSIKAGETATVNITWNTTGKAGEHIIWVEIDPGDMIQESNETNNKASKSIYIVGYPVFDTGEGTYPSIMGIHKGMITPLHNVTVNKMYTYPCPGTGGHSEHVWIYGTGINESATWNGYQGAGDYHYIEFSELFTLEANVTYNYTIKTGSYPQIHHTDRLETDDGVITCDYFVDANGKTYTNWIPAIRLE